MENGTKPTLESQIVNGCNILGGKVYDILRKKDGNLVFSPVCVHMVLSMLYQGAHGETSYTLAYTLKNRSANTTAEAYKKLLERLNNLKQISLIFAHKIYGTKNKTDFKKEFENRIVKNFNSEIDVVNLQKHKTATSSINKWARTKTKNKVKNLLGKRSLKNNFGLVGVSGIFYTGEWCSQFEESKTKHHKFFIDKQNSIKVKVMYQKMKLLYMHDDQLEAQIVEIPYKNYSVKMVIVLPFENSNVKNLEKKLATIDLTTIRNSLQVKDVHLYLPKFKIESRLRFGEILCEIGFENIFDEGEANFEGVAKQEGENLFLGEIFQKACIKVNEKGDAKKALPEKYGKGAKNAPGMLQTVTFKVDRPAIFFVIASHGDVASILLYGRLCRPEY